MFGSFVAPKPCAVNGPVPAPFVLSVSVLAPFATMYVFLFVISSGSSATGFAVTNLTAYFPAARTLLELRNAIVALASEPVFGSRIRLNV